MHMEKDQWLYEIKPQTGFFNLNLKEIWRYRDLIGLFVKRDVVTYYKQTILGPLWYLIQPLFTMVIFTVIFNRIAGIGTGNVPAYLFNLAGIVTWNYFKDVLTQTSDTFKKNEHIFSKVYFPRVVMPISIVFSNLLKFGIQLLIFIGFYLYFVFVKKMDIHPNPAIIFFPFILMIMALFGLGLGMIISSLVTKYRDLTFLINFGISLFMYISAVFYPISLAEEKLGKYAWIVTYNPLAHIIETVRYMFLNVGQISVSGLIYTTIVSIAVFILGLMIFNKTEKSFVDTI